MSPTVDELADGYTTIGVANGHVPSSTGTDKRKADTIRALSTQMATLDNLPHWIIGGDFNLEESVVKVHSLRHQYRICTKIHREMKEGKLREVPDHRKDLYKRFLNGRLNQEIDDATWKHGYGALIGKQIGAFEPRFG